MLLRLRDIAPIKGLSHREAQRLAEAQARLMLEIYNLTDPPVPTALITQLSTLRVRLAKSLVLPGVTAWQDDHWEIKLNAKDSQQDRRITLAHEFKHIIDDRFIRVLYPQLGRMSELDRAEQAAEHFAVSLLMPADWVKRSWHSGLQQVQALARVFDVDPVPMCERIRELGLVDPGTDCLHYHVAPS